MNVNGDLKNAQIEIQPDTSACTQMAKIQYDKTEKGIAVGTGQERKMLFPMGVNTLAEFRSAMYPIGSLLTSTLNGAEFETEMGASIWINVKDLLKTYDGGGTVAAGKALVPATSALGIVLLSRGGNTQLVGGVAWPEWESPEGRYLRVAGADTLGNSYTNEQYLDSKNKTHKHQETITSTRWIFHSSHYASGSWPNGGNHDHDIRSSSSNVPMYNNGNTDFSKTTHNITRGNGILSGEDQSRPESVVYNLYLKVER